MTVVHLARVVRGPTSVGDALVVDDAGNVAAVASRADVPAASRTVDHGNAVIVPGIRDAHIHPVSYAAAVTGTVLKSAPNLAAVFRRLRTAAAALPSDAPLIAHRLDDTTLAERRLPTAAELDAVTNGRPTLVMRYCGHVAIANSTALAAAGIGSTTPDPDGGIIDRDLNGAPTGVLREGAVDLVTGRLGRTGPVSPDDLERALLALAGAGITSIGAMVRMSYGPLGGMGDEIGLLLAIADRLPIRVHVYCIAATEDELGEARHRLAGNDQRLRWAGFKAFGDGSFGGHTAAMFEPYADSDGTGELLLTDTDRRLAGRTLEMGGDVAIHAIGDRAAAHVLDFFATLVDGGADGRRLRMEHASVLRPADRARMGRLGVGAAVQPAFLTSEAAWLEARIGSSRLESTYAFRSMLADGIRMAGSSDSPVEPPDAWAAMAATRTRHEMVPGETIDASAALAMYTSGGADLLGEPTPLVTGSPADFVVVDRDPVAVDSDGLTGTLVHRTYVSGTEVALDPELDVWQE
jgi:predicted amidohydrolase YtcJ